MSGTFFFRVVAFRTFLRTLLHGPAEKVEKGVRTLFLPGDPLSTTFPDPDRAHEEHRQITIGMSERGRILVVAHVDQGETVRIISARRATRRERRFYEEDR